MSNSRLAGFGRALLAAAALGFLGGCASTQAGKVQPPVILFWTYAPQLLPHLTHATPRVHLSGGPEDPFDQTYLLQRGVLPLRWMLGKGAAKQKSAEELAKHWGAAAKKGYVGIAIDEFGSREQRINRTMVQALQMTRERHPELFIAVWHAGWLKPLFWSAYRRCADLVMLEEYFSGTERFPPRLAGNLLLARLAGIEPKTVFALGINDRDKRLQTGMKPWANSPAELEAQMRWIRRHAPRMPGIAFFASRASAEIQQQAEAIAWKIFGSPK